MTVKNIFEFLNQKFPTDTACDFDNVGLLVGDGNNEVTSAVISLDCTPSAIAKAVEENANLIITHHPVIFDPLKSVTAESAVYELIKKDISIISMHTNLDVGIGGVNDSLCKTLGFTEFEKYTAADGYVLNQVNLSSPISAERMAEHLKSKLGGCIKYVSGKKPIKNILFCSGSGGNYLYDAINSFDALITADVKHNVFSDAERMGIALFDAGHFNTEDVVIEPLKELLKVNFKEINFVTSHTSAIKFL